MAAITLAQLAKLETEVFKKYILQNMIRLNRLQEFIPFTPVSSLKNIAVRYKTLPTVAFRKIGAGYTADYGDTEQVWESVYGYGGDIQLDNVFGMVKNTVEDLRALNTKMKLLAMAIKFNDYLVNGDHGTDADGFEGLKKRLAAMPSRQTSYFAGSTAAALDPTASVANGNTFWAKLEEMHKHCNNGQSSLWLMNEDMQLGLGRSLRYIQASAGNWLSTTKDSFDRDVTTLWGSPIVDPGLLNDQSTEIIANEADGAGTATNAQRIFCLSFDEMQGIQGIQLNDFNPYDPLSGGEMESIPSKLIRIDWWVGLTSFGSYGFAQGRNVEPLANWT